MATLQSATQRFSDWFQGSALEPTALAGSACRIDERCYFLATANECEAEPREQCVPRQSLGTRQPGNEK